MVIGGDALKHGLRVGFGFCLIVIAMLFILSHREVSFIFPIVVELRACVGFVLGELAACVVVLLVALAYVWRRGALEWR